VSTFFDKSTFHPREERKLRALCRRKLIKAWALLALWYAAVMGGWGYMTVTMNRPMLGADTFVYLILLALPFFRPFRVHRILFAKTFYANVGQVKYTEDLKVVQGAVMRRGRTVARAYEREVVSVTFHGDNGERETIVYNEHNVRGDNCYYKYGDRVLVLKGLRYPVKVPLPETEKMLCPVCGIFLKDDAADPYDTTPRKCSWCGADFE